MNEPARQGDRRMTLREVAEVTGAAYRTVAAYAQKAGWTENGKLTLLDERQVTVILEAMKADKSSGTKSNLAAQVQGIDTTKSPHDLPGSLEGIETCGDRRMTVKEVARQFGCDIHTVTNHANRLFPAKIRNGVKTFFDEREVTLILDSIKSVKSQNDTLKVDLQGMETALTPILEVSKLTELIRQSYQRIDEIKNAEIARLNADLASTKALLSKRESGLETIQRIAEAGGLIMSDRDDIESMYGRRRV